MKSYSDAPIPTSSEAEFALWKRYVDEQLARMTSTKGKRILVVGTHSDTGTGSSSHQGTITYGVTFVVAPIIVATVQVVGFDLLIRWTGAATTTTVPYNVFTNAGGTFTAAYTIHWHAHGTLQTGITL